MKRLVGLIIIVFATSQAVADLQGNLSAYSADISKASKWSIGAGLNTSSEMDFYGVRGNYKATDSVLLFAETGRLEIDREVPSVVGGTTDALADSTTFRFGTVLGLPDIPNINLPLAVRLAYQAGTSEGTVADQPAEFETTIISAELMVSGKLPAVESIEKLTWYAGIGRMRLDQTATIDFAALAGIPIPVPLPPLVNNLLTTDTTENETTFSAGLILPVDQSEIYVGFEDTNETFVGIGYRYRFE